MTEVFSEQNEKQILVSFASSIFQKISKVKQAVVETFVKKYTWFSSDANVSEDTPRKLDVVQICTVKLPAFKCSRGILESKLSKRLNEEGWRQAFAESSIHAAFSDGYRHYYRCGPHCKSMESYSNFGSQKLTSLLVGIPNDKLKLSSLFIFKRIDSLDRVKKKKRRNEMLLKSEKYLSQFSLPPFQLPHVSVPNLALEKGRGNFSITIVTTACLPWLTGTKKNFLVPPHFTTFFSFYKYIPF